MKSYILSSTLLLNCFATTISLAQKNFKPGFVVVGQQDTLRGLINYRNWSKNPVSVEFKNSLEEPTKVYHINAISAFAVHGEVYVKAAVMIDKTYSNLNELPTTPVAEMEPDTALLRVVVSGPKSLYYLNNRLGKVQFFIKKDQGYVHLVNYRYQLTGQQSGIMNVEGFKQQLQNYLRECQINRNEIASLRFNESSLKKLFDGYYACTGKQPTFTAKADESTLEKGILAGTSISKIRFSGVMFPHLTNADFDQSYAPTVGVFLNFEIPRTRKKLRLNNEIVFSSLKARGEYQDYTNDQHYKISETTIGLSYLKLNNLVRFQILSKSISPFLSVGISNGLLIANTNKLETHTIFYTEDRVTQEKAMDVLRKYEQGLILGAGVRVKKITLEARYERSNGISVYSLLKSSIQRFHVLVSYQL